MDSLAVTFKSPPQSPSSKPFPIAECYTFMPKCSSKLPRAWERKPSTPFAPRNVSQKIWKRYDFRDTNAYGALQTAVTEKHAIKKLRLEGHDATAYITSWDDELHENRHKESAHPNTSAIIVQRLNDVRKSVLAHESDGHLNLLSINQIVEDQHSAYDKSSDQDMKSYAPKTPPNDRQGFHSSNREGACAEALRSDGEAMAQQLELGEEQGLTEQNLDEQTAMSVIAVSSQDLCLFTDKQTARISHHGSAAEELPAISLGKDYTAGNEQISPKQPMEQLVASRLEATYDEAIGSETLISKQQPIINIDCQPPYLRVRVADGMITKDAPSDGLILNDEAQNGFTPQLGNVEVQQGRAVSSEPVIESSNVPSEEPLHQVELENTGRESILKEQLGRHQIEAVDTVRRKTFQPQFLTDHSLLTQTQETPFTACAVVPNEDTDYLHAFLTRAKAKKVAREGSPEKVDRVPPSQITRSRAALLPLSTNSPSPKKAKKHQREPVHEIEVVGLHRAGSPRRRSGRTRLPQPQKTATVHPNTIPVRRSNSTEFVFLRNTDAAQVVLATRANTKRNQGKAVAPKLKLQALSRAQKSPSKSPKPRKGKEVSWKDEPTYFRKQDDDTEEVGEERKMDERPRLRKVRRLLVGAANGTPAPSKTMTEDVLEVRTPMPRKRGKVRV